MKSQESAAPVHGPPSVSQPLQAVAVVILGLIIGVCLQQLLTHRNAILGDTEQQMARLDMVFSEATSRCMEMADFVARSTAEALHEANGLPPPGPFEAKLRHRITGVQQIHGIIVSDITGTVLYRTDPDAPPVLIGPAAMALAWHKAHPEPGLRISPPLRDANGTWTALLTRPFHGPDGNLLGMVGVSLNLSYFESLFQAVELHENGAVILHLRDGTILARYPHVDTAIGTSMAALPPFAEVLAHADAGTLLMVSPIDGSVRVTAIRALQKFPLAIMVSVDEGRLLADWRHEAWTFVVAAFCASVLVVGLLLLLAHRSRTVECVLADARNAHAAAEEANRQLQDEIAERERAESALRQTQRIEAIGQLTGGVAHDFNNLLTVVLGNVDLLQRRGDDEPPNASFTARLHAIRSAAERGATLTSHLLSFARRQPMLPRAVDLNALVVGMKDLLDTAIGGAVAFETRLAPDLWPAMADPTQIELVILNLVINARDATPSKGLIVVETMNVRLGPRGRADDPPLGDYVQVAVRDTGTGMTADVKARAFEPFFTTKAPGSGSGLGLSQVFGTTQQLGGGVHIESEPGHGTVITVLLPRAMAKAMALPPRRLVATSPTAYRGNATILVVDDEEPVRLVVAASLREMGYDVREAGSGAAALEVVRQNPGVHLLLTDVVMPAMSGIQLADVAQAARPDLAVVYMSGYADMANLSDRSRRRRHVRKPYRPDDFREQIEAALQERRVPAA